MDDLDGSAFKFRVIDMTGIPEDLSDSDEFNRRQRVMKRLYRRVLDFNEIEGEHDDWMWRATVGAVDRAFSKVRIEDD